MSEKCIGFVGFGEVGSVFASVIAESEVRVLVYDVLFTTGNEETVQSRIQAEAIETASLAEVVSASDYILSTVTTQVAVEVAKACAPYLSPGQVYVDLNSTSPAVKVKLAAIIQETGAAFVEGAILGAVGASGALTQVILTGSQARAVARTLNSLGLNCAEFGHNFGDAASFKMLRSVFSKGIEALLLEMLVAARRAGIGLALWEDIVSFMTKNTFERVATNWIESHALAHERRYYEMVQVVKTLRELGVEPIMSAATLAFFERSLQLNLDDVFQAKPDSPEAVVEHLDHQLDAATITHVPSQETSEVLPRDKKPQRSERLPSEKNT